MTIWFLISEGRETPDSESVTPNRDKMRWIAVLKRILLDLMSQNFLCAKCFWRFKGPSFNFGLIHSGARLSLFRRWRSRTTDSPPRLSKLTSFGAFRSSASSRDTFALQIDSSPAFSRADFSFSSIAHVPFLCLTFQGPISEFRPVDHRHIDAWAWAAGPKRQNVEPET